MPKITSKQSKELKCLALLGEPSPEIIAWVASKRAEPGTAKAQRVGAPRCITTSKGTHGYVRVGAESMQRIAEAAEKRAADRAGDGGMGRTGAQGGENLIAAEWQCTNVITEFFRPSLTLFLDAIILFPPHPWTLPVLPWDLFGEISVVFRTPDPIVSLNSRAQLLVRTLVSDLTLPPMIHSLELLPINGPKRLEGREWELVLSRMRNLTNLGISQHVELTDIARQGISFRLTHFTAFDHLVESWGAFLHTQSTIVQLELDLTMAGPAPFLPALKTLIARAESAAQILERNSVAELILSQPDTDLRGIPDDALGIFARAQPGLVTLRLGCGELLALMNLPNVCVGVVNLILDGDGTWEWDRQLRTLRGALSELRKSKSPALRTLRLVAWDRQPSARNVFKAVRSRSVAGRLSSVHYCNEVRGCHHWARSKDELGDEAGCDFAKSKLLESVEETPSWMEEEDTDEDVVLPPNSEYWDLDDSDRELSPDSD
ncbi:hypothetical protein C8J57DRAFT_1600428, partial [Mycena rebaudengoi]